MKRFGIVFAAVMACVFVVSIPKVGAVDSPQSYLPLTCDRQKGNYKPMTTLVLVPLSDTLSVKTGATSKEVAQALFFDFAYVRGNNVAPLNALSYNGEIVFTSCDYTDYLANIVTANDTGYFLLGVYGPMPVKSVQELINKYKFNALVQGELVTITDEKNTTIALANSKPCGELCMGLVASKTGVEKREYKVTTQEPSYAKSIRQKELVSLSIKIKNDGDFPIYPTGAAALSLVPNSKGLSPLYHSSWLAPTLIARIPGMLLPGEESAISVTLGAPMLPGKYNEALSLKMGNTLIGKPMTLSFTVENDNYKLGRIVSRDGASFANLRGTPHLKGEILSRLDIGSYVIIKDYQDAWVKIETKEGRVGWVYKPFIREL